MDTILKTWIKKILINLIIQWLHFEITHYTKTHFINWIASRFLTNQINNNFHSRRLHSKQKSSKCINENSVAAFHNIISKRRCFSFQARPNEIIINASAIFSRSVFCPRPSAANKLCYQVANEGQRDTHKHTNRWCTFVLARRPPPTLVASLAGKGKINLFFCIFFIQHVSQSCLGSVASERRSDCK